MWFINIVFGLIDFSATDVQQITDSQSAIVLPLVMAIAWWGIRVVIAFSEESLSAVITHGHSHHLPRMKKWLRTLLMSKSKSALPFIAIATLPIVSFFGYENGFFNGRLNLHYRDILFVQAWAAWISFISLLYIVYLGQRLITMHMHKKLRIRLFEIEQFSPICQLTIFNFFIPSAIVTITTASAMLNPYSDFDFVAVFIALTIVLCFLSFPMFTIRSVLGARKEQSLERINSALNAQIDSADINNNRRLVDDFERLQFVSDLLCVRKEINEINLWPMDTPFAIKMGIIAMIPIMSWIGAGIVSQLLKTVT